MAITGISDDIYWQNPNISTSTISSGKDASALGMEDFLQLMVAQMQNQDVFNPVSDTEFIAQMAQFSSLQGINTIQQYQLSSYAVSYVGKEVIIANPKDDGTLERVRGMVQKVGFSSGEPLVCVDGKEYPLYTVMDVVTPDYVAPQTETDPPQFVEPDDDN